MTTVKEHLHTLAKYGGLQNHEPQKGNKFTCIDCFFHDIWVPIKQELGRAILPWAKVRGPVGNLILTMDRWGIEMPNPYTIRIPDAIGNANEWQYQHGACTKVFLKEFQEYLIQELWEQGTHRRDEEITTPRAPT